MRHPDVGPLDLRLEKLPIGDSGGQLLVVYHAAPGSASAAALARLAVADKQELSGLGVGDGAAS
jgi:hypothetical protein